MFDVKEILRKLSNKPLTKEERYSLIYKNKVEDEVLEYLMDLFGNLTIEVYGDYKGNIMELMQEEKLEGFCWQTTESAIVFLQDNDYIERGNLKFSAEELYYHSWICFCYKNIWYVFDPCLNFLCKKEIYDKAFEPLVNGSMTAKKVTEYIIYCIQNPKPKVMSSIDNFFRCKCPEEWEYLDKFTTIDDDDFDVNAPKYRNRTGYMAEIEDGQISKLTAHYYSRRF